MTDDDGRTQGPAVAPTDTTTGRTKASRARPLATRSTLPLFPSTANERSQNPSRPRAPLAVRRQKPAVARVRSQVDGPPSDRKLSFEDPQSAAPHVSPRAAAPLVRLAAGVLDTVLLASLDAVVIVLTLRMAELDLQSLDTLPAAPLAGFLILLNGGYVVVLTLVGGQTFGKMVCRVRVVNRAGHPVTTSVALVRALGYLMSVLPLGLGVVWMFFDTERCALHDRLAGTRVLMVPATSRKDSR